MDNRQLRDSIQILANTYLKDIPGIVFCEVTALQEQEQTCTCKPLTGNGQALMKGVLLSTEENDGFLLIPTVGSTVIVCKTDNNQPFILLYSNLDKAYIITETLSQFNDGKAGGLVKVIKLTTKLNNLENKVNTIIAQYNAHTHISAAPGSPTGPAVPLVTGTLTPTQRAEIENSKVTHGPE